MRNFDGFVREQVPLEDAQIALVRGGAGPPLLLLHGFPETHVAWRRVAPQLAAQFSVVVPDLPGYGDSVGPPFDAAHEGYSKRAMAKTLVSLMRSLGYPAFAVAGHDRGARVAYRMALDYPGVVTRLAVLEIVPTLEMADHPTYTMAYEIANWILLAQPAPVPETLLGHASDFYLRHIVESWAGTPDAIDAEALAEYARCFHKPEVIRAMCEEYRAGAGIDVDHDRADVAAGRRISCPVLILWSRNGLVAKYFDPIAVWRRWAEHVRGRALECGHFLMEEAPAEVGAALGEFFGR